MRSGCATRPVDGRATGGAGVSTRLHGLDALRAVALGLGVVLHTLAPFLPGTTWMEVGPVFSGTAATTVTVVHLFRMVLFMLLAGYFGRLVLQRRGARAYAGDRARRILLPVVALSPVVLMSIIGVEEVARRLRGDPEPLPPLPSGVPYWLFLDPAHLWFLWVLAQAIAVVLLVRWLLVRLAGVDRAARWASRAGALLVSPGGVALASLPYLGALLLQGTARYGVHQPSGVAPELAPLLAYLGAFLVGWLLHAHADALARLARSRSCWTHLGVAVALTAPAVVLQETGVRGGPAEVGHAALVALAGWAWTYGLVGLFLRLLPQGSPVVRYLADSAYWVYLAHLPLTAVAQLLLARTGWYPPLQLLTAWLVCGAVLLLSYDLLVRGTWLGGWLNGRRRPSALLSARGAAVS